MPRDLLVVDVQWCFDGTCKSNIEGVVVVMGTCDERELAEVR